jgi:hypothetical protein
VEVIDKTDTRITDFQTSIASHIDSVLKACQSRNTWKLHYKQKQLKPLGEKLKLLAIVFDNNSATGLWT